MGRIYSRTITTVILLIILVGVFFSPTFVAAQIDTRCFTVNDCVAARNGDPSGFYQSRETAQACQGETDAHGTAVGFCNPDTQVRTTISIGGVRVFANVGDYIQTIFRFGIAAIVLLSTIMIIVGGVQWMLPGNILTTGTGDQQQSINQAKSRIKNALIGLAIGIFSITLLYQINPYLIHFRLPQTWMINQIALSSVQCNDNVGQSVSETADGAQIKAEEALCGRTYILANASNNQCIGLSCPTDGETCVPLLDGKRACKPGLLSGKITAINSESASEFSEHIIDNNLQLIAVCKNGRLEQIDEIDVLQENRQTPKDQPQTYQFWYSTQIDNACRTYGDGLVGFFLGGEINDEGSGLGSAGGALTTGIDDWHAIGKSFDTSDQTTSHSCAENLSLRAFSVLQGGGVADCTGDLGVQYCSCSAISDPKTLKKLVLRPDFTKHLFSLEELKKGFTCDIHITRLAFPAIDNIDLVEDDTDCFEYQ